MRPCFKALRAAPIHNHLVPDVAWLTSAAGRIIRLGGRAHTESGFSRTVSLTIVYNSNNEQYFSNIPLVNFHCMMGGNILRENPDGASRNENLLMLYFIRCWRVIHWQEIVYTAAAEISTLNK